MIKKEALPNEEWANINQEHSEKLVPDCHVHSSSSEYKAAPLTTNDDIHEAVVYF